MQSRRVDTTITCNGSAGFNQNKYVKVPPKADGILAKINVDVGGNVHAVILVQDETVPAPETLRFFVEVGHVGRRRGNLVSQSKDGGKMFTVPSTIPRYELPASVGPGKSDEDCPVSQ